MQNFSKMFIVGLLCFLLGAGAVFAYTQYTTTKQENINLKAQLTTTPNPTTTLTLATPTASPKTASPSPIASEKPAEQTGTITGKLGYPSEGIPPLEVFAIRKDDSSTYFKVTTKANQSMFELSNVTPGTYVVLAYVIGQNSSFAGGYTPAVECGLSVECKDHSLSPVVVTAGETTENVNLQDWYAPEGTFPAKPK